MRIITYIITFYFNVQVWRDIISMFTILSVVLIFGTANMEYIFFIHVIVCGRRKIRKKDRKSGGGGVHNHNSIKSKPLLECF